MGNARIISGDDAPQYKKMKKAYVILLVVMSAFLWMACWKKDMSVSEDAAHVIHGEIKEVTVVGCQNLLKAESVATYRTGIRLDTDDVKKTYFVNDVPELDGLLVVGIYNNGSERLLTEGEYEVLDVDLGTKGVKEVVVTSGEHTQSFGIAAEYVLTEVEPQTKYSSASLNLREGPGTDYNVLTTISINMEVTLIGKVDNGWAKIVHGENEYYCSGKYLSDEKTEIKKASAGVSIYDTAAVAAEMGSRPGMIGRLFIPSLGVEVAVFNSFTQETVDNPDSAGVGYGAQRVIADHKNQGFSAIKSAIPNETTAYINNSSTVQAYICIDKNKGQNVNVDLLDCNGNSLSTQNAGGLCMYTCNEHWSKITYTMWQPI